MNTPLSGIDFESRRIYAALFKEVLNNELKGWNLTSAKLILWYYQSSIALLPDIVPGLGNIDHYLLAQTMLWICKINPDLIDPELEKTLIEDLRVYFSTGEQTPQEISTDSQ